VSKEQTSMRIFRKSQPNPSDPGAAIIHLRGLVKTYRGLSEDVQALKGVDLQVYPGEFVVVTGRSGSGKTTLINLASGLDLPTSGEIFTCGAALHSMSLDQAARWRRRNMGVIFQSFELLPSLTVLQNVMLPMDFAGGWSYRSGQRRAMELLEKVEIADHARKRPAALSGGQQQRAAIARALANDPAVLFADEPTGSLDSQTAGVVVDLFAELARQGRTILMVSHDADIARQADRWFTLADGTIVGGSENLKFERPTLSLRSQETIR